MAVSTFLRPEYPFLFAATLRPDPPSEDGGSTIELQPLYCKNEGGDAPNCTREPVGAPLGPFAFSASDDGVILVEFGEVTLIGDANPVSGRDITARLELRGRFADDAMCSNVVGEILAPIGADLVAEENHFGAVYLGPIDAEVDFKTGPIQSSCAPE